MNRAYMNLVQTEKCDLHFLNNKFWELTPDFGWRWRPVPKIDYLQDTFGHIENSLTAYEHRSQFRNKKGALWIIFGSLSPK